MSQSVEIELAISYDQQYLDKYQQDTQNPFNSVEDRIDAVVDGLNKVYINYGVHFKLVAIESFGNINLSGTSVDPPDRMTHAWIKKDGACYNRDMILHLTGSGLKTQNTVGVSSGSRTVCNSDNYDFDGGFNPFVVIAKFQSLWYEIKTAAHELGHGMRLTHETNETCSSLSGNSNSHYFMCQGAGGQQPSSSTNFILSSFNINRLNTALLGDCVDVDNYDEDIVCTDFVAEFISDKSVETICNEEQMTQYNIFIKNDEASRSFGNPKIIFNDLPVESDFYELGIESINVNGNILLIENLFTNYNFAGSGSGDFVVWLPSFSLGPNQVYNINFELDPNNAYVFDLAFPRFAYLSFSSSINPGLGLSGTGSLSIASFQDSRSLEMEDGSSTTDLINKMNEYENGSYYDIDQLEIIINGTFYIDQDFELSERWSLKMKEGSRIEVINGSTFTTMNNMIGPCFDARWGEIYIESGSNLYFENVTLTKGINGVITENAPNDNSTISDIIVKSCTIEDFTENGIKIATNSTATLQTININNIGKYGIDLTGNVNAKVLIGINIDDAETGIRIHNSSNWNQVNDCTFIDCIFGVRYHGASGSIHDSKFRNTRIGISLLESNLTYVYKNSIGYHTGGISVEKSNGVSINRNEIGIPSDYGSTSIFLSEVNYSSILGNQNMLASNFGIQGIQINNLKIQGWTEPGSEIITSHNNINIQGNQNTFSGGISLTMANKCEITDNFIFASEVAYGIETNNATSSKIRNNHVSIASIPNMFRSAAVKNSGGINAYVLENETYSSDNANGIEVQNTSFSHYNCNDIYDTHDALCIEHNSDFHELGTNRKVNSHNIDFITRSRLGEQVNKGNAYQGNRVRGYFANIEDRDGSLFFVDENEPFHMPTDRIPDLDQWFVDNNKNDDVCLSNVGPTGQATFFSSVTRLCDYWDDIKALKNSDAKLFLIKLTHLIRYFDAHPLLDIPDCIELDPVFINLCGFHEVMDIVDRLNNLGDIDPSRTTLENDISELITLNDKYSVSSNDSERAIKMQEIITKFNTTKPEMDQEILSDAIDLISIKTDLQSVNCNDELINIMQKTWLKYIEELNEDHTDLNPRLDSDIETTSMLCSDEYGDAVHLARSIASVQGSTIYYDANDGCRDTGYSSPRQSNNNNISMVISPNPSYGMLNVDFGEDVTGTISVINTSGTQVLSQRIIKTSVYNLDIEVSGMYIIKFVHENGEVINKKALIIN